MDPAIIGAGSALGGVFVGGLLEFLRERTISRDTRMFEIRRQVYGAFMVVVSHHLRERDRETVAEVSRVSVEVDLVAPKATMDAVRGLTQAFHQLVKAEKARMPIGSDDHRALEAISARRYRDVVRLMKRDLGLSEG